MIAMAGSICVCNECVDLLYDIAQKKKSAKTRRELENAKVSWKNSTGFTPTCQPCAPTSIVASIEWKARLNCSHK